MFIVIRVIKGKVKVITQRKRQKKTYTHTNKETNKNKRKPMSKQVIVVVQSVIQYSKVNAKREEHCLHSIWKFHAWKGSHFLSNEIKIVYVLLYRFQLTSNLHRFQSAPTRAFDGWANMFGWNIYSWLFISDFWTSVIHYHLSCIYLFLLLMKIRKIKMQRTLSKVGVWSPMYACDAHSNYLQSGTAPSSPFPSSPIPSHPKRRNCQWVLFVATRKD